MVAVGSDVAGGAAGGRFIYYRGADDAAGLLEGVLVVVLLAVLLRQYWKTVNRTVFRMENQMMS